MRLAAAVKAGNPDAGLLCAGVQVEQELVEDGFKALLVLAIADKGFQFVAQDALGRLGVVFRNLGHAVVGEAIFLGGLVVDVPVQHGVLALFIRSVALDQSWASNGTAR
jgi:hypothetical protein